MKDIQTIVTHFDNSEEFKNAYLFDLPNGGVFVNTKEEVGLGSAVLVYICFPDIPEGVPLRGTVVWRRPPTKWRSVLKPGLGIGFGEIDLEKRDFLLSYSIGKLSVKRTKSRRLPVDFQVDFLTADSWTTGRAINISREGLFILTDKKIVTDSPVQMKLFLNRKANADLYQGRVAWWCGRKPEIGIGVEFLFRSPIRRRKIYHFIDEREEKLISKIPGVARPTYRSRDSF
ncbi:MAG: hypothetical protein GY847_28170 [Proteobacteria bacterium]|nr:hypothetical protein [Pseudomonadota bacterium]